MVLTLSVEGIGWVILECSEEVLLGMTSECSAVGCWSLVMGLSLVPGRRAEEYSLRECTILKDWREKRADSSYDAPKRFVLKILNGWALRYAFCNGRKEITAATAALNERWLAQRRSEQSDAAIQLLEK